MEFVIALLLVAGFVYYLLSKEKRKSKKLAEDARVLDESLRAELDKVGALGAQVAELSKKVNRLNKYEAVADAEAEAKKIMASAKEKEMQAVEARKNALQQASAIVDEARKNAEAIGGDAYRALQQHEQLSAAARAMKNTIEGYGDRYIKPSHSVLDDLALTYSHAQAGQDLKLARERVALLIDSGKAATCDYVEVSRQQTAIRFVLDAFNGKVDSILSRVKSTNHGTLEQEIRDAAAMVNLHGAAFKAARILPDYLNARLHELLCAVRVRELLERDREEQRAAREQLRDEERARKECERAMREAEREEELARKALEKAQGMLERATGEQRARYEEQIAQLGARLAEAESKGQRAMSMAQQTRAGHVYIISNVGSFGDGVYKIGMTRRLEPLDRVRELGDASVPFEFDVHAMIWSADAPALEKALHKEFVTGQVNKVNPRKEFFRVGLARVRQVVEGMGLSAAWTMAADAAEYRETLALEERMRSDPAALAEWERTQAEAEYQAEVVTDDGEPAMASR